MLIELDQEISAFEQDPYLQGGASAAIGNYEPLKQVLTDLEQRESKYN